MRNDDRWNDAGEIVKLTVDNGRSKLKNERQMI